MQEYEDLCHKNQNIEDASSTDEFYYLPIQALFKSSDSTSLNLVDFDGSCRSRNVLCINDTLLVGTTIQK
jgi:hypothetical protein